MKTWRWILTISGFVQIVSLLLPLMPVMADDAAFYLKSPAGQMTLSEKPATMIPAQNVPETDGEDELDILEQEYESNGRIDVNDPLYYWNVSMFHFNDKFYFCLLKPVSQAYRFLVPEMARQGVKNFFYNLAAPVRIVNSALQGDVDKTAGEISRFMLNSTVGVLGFANPAKEIEQLNPSAEDLGQTLGRYGIGNGIYLVWPFLGPSTLRDSLGSAGDSFLNPIQYVNPSEASLSLRGLKTVNTTSFRIGDYEAFKEAAVAPYESLRDAYVQRRDKQVHE